MKKVFILLAWIMFSLTILQAQTKGYVCPLPDSPPQAFSFKATIQGFNGQPIIDKTISLRISILQGGMSGFTAYSEFFTPTTNHYSQVDVEIGRGNVLYGTFADIDWSADEYFLKVEVDVKGGSYYKDLLTTQLLSVPYSLYSGESKFALSADYNNLSNKPVLFDGTWTSLTEKPTTVSGFGITDAVTITGDQTVAGNKNYTGTTTVLPPVNATDAATKAYVDVLKQQINDLINNLNSTGAFKLNVALNKPTTCQSFETGGESSKANDADGTNNSYWQAKPYSQWWEVDLGANYDLTSIAIRNYVDGSSYYQYSIQVSIDDVTFNQVASKVNRNVATDAGDSFSVNTTARYVRVIMTYNSSRMSVQISDFRAYGTPVSGLPTYSITASSGLNGKISPLGTLSVTQNTSYIYTIKANTGFKIEDVSVDGISVGPVQSYTFNNISANHTISATFSVLNTYNITSSAETGGTISPSGITEINQGASVTYNIAPNNGYQISNVIVDNISIGSQETYTFNDINSDHTISASFVQVFTIDARAHLGGSISPSGFIIVSQGASQSFTFFANTGYKIADVLVDGISIGPVSTYMFTNVMASHTIRVTFSAIL